MKTVRYETTYNYGLNILHICSDGKGMVAVAIDNQFQKGVIHDLIVHPSIQRQGRGNKLLSLVESEIKSSGKALAEINTEYGSWQERWYIRKGYRHIFTDRGITTLTKQL